MTRYSLTEIQVKTFQAIAAGKGYKDIAQQRGVSESAIKQTCQQVQNILGVKNNLAVLKVITFDGETLTHKETPHMSPLNKRQKNALVFLSQGFRYKKSKEILGIGISGIKYHISEILKKYDVETIEQALVKAILQGDITQVDFLEI